MKIYNTLTRRKEEFTPIRPGHVNMYVCGITAYDSCHMGHARAAVAFDVVVRYLRYKGYDVKFVKNYTDIDDKIINRANKEKRDWKELAKYYIKEYSDDMKKLGNLTPDIEPKATDHINEMIATIQKLLDNGLAYKTSSGVYFSVRKFEGYGKLSGKNIEDLESGARVEVDEEKKDPLDFALWKKAKEGEPSWPSPWGLGRPGWHIECSAMSRKYLGDTFDIHGGGLDLIFPHHENELAQAGGVSGKLLARYWLHNGYVTIDQEKMSKSLGNFFTLEDIFRKYEPEAVRYFLLSTHYRHPIDFNEEKLKEAAISLDGLYQTFRQVEGIEAEIKKTGPAVGPGRGDTRTELNGKFREALDNDFNTSMALGLMHDLSREINQAINQWYSQKDRGWEILKRRDILWEWGQTLGLFFKKEKDEGSDKIKELIAMREKARKNKEWKKADEIRDEFLKMGIIIEDTPRGTRWYKEGKV